MGEQRDSRWWKLHRQRSRSRKEPAGWLWQIQGAWVGVGRRVFLKGWAREHWAGAFKGGLLQVGAGTAEERGMGL